ncbi:hypothetical protein [Dongshaea marina]|uniref:hypothetical protein n=1 Tax=Dongshaea marina TaxID=2047966 RepID=UPI000D3E2457|nr:hypothetical protein [Dongshaea marina]
MLILKILLRSIRFFVFSLLMMIRLPVIYIITFVSGAMFITGIIGFLLLWCVSGESLISASGMLLVSVAGVLLSMLALGYDALILLLKPENMELELII